MNRRARIAALAVLAASAGPGHATTMPDGDAGTAIDRLYQADQADRAHHPIDWKRVHPADARRRKQVHILLDRGAITSGRALEEAAFIFQHGERPADFLLAHGLALAAMAQGDRAAGWIAAATLDRYLRAIGRRQVFGTQFRRTRGGIRPEPDDAALMPPTLRAAIGVAPDGDQASPSSPASAGVASAAGRSK